MADKVNLTIDQGSTYSVDFLVYYANNTPADLTDYTASGSIRKHYTSNNAVSFAMATYANGTVRASLSANQTSSLTDGRYVYDIKITNSFEETTRIVEGIVSVSPQVTR